MQTGCLTVREHSIIVFVPPPIPDSQHTMYCYCYSYSCRNYILYGKLLQLVSWATEDSHSDNGNVWLNNTGMCWLMEQPADLTAKLSIVSNTTHHMMKLNNILWPEASDEQCWTIGAWTMPEKPKGKHPHMLRQIWLHTSKTVCFFNITDFS